MYIVFRNFLLLVQKDEVLVSAGQWENFSCEIHLCIEEATRLASLLINSGIRETSQTILSGTL